MQAELPRPFGALLGDFAGRFRQHLVGTEGGLQVDGGRGTDGGEPAPGSNTCTTRTRRVANIAAALTGLSYDAEPS